MPILFTCPNPKCPSHKEGKNLNAKDEQGGRTLPCPYCKEPVTIPSPGTPVPQKQPFVNSEAVVEPIPMVQPTAPKNSLIPPFTQENMASASYEYKCVAAPMNLTISSKDSESRAIAAFSNLINQNCNGGWDFFSMEQISVTSVPENPGCLAALLIMIGIMKREEATKSNFNMLVFRKAK